MDTTYADELWVARNAALRCLSAVKNLLNACSSPSGKRIRRAVARLYQKLRIAGPLVDAVGYALAGSRGISGEPTSTLVVLTQSGASLVQEVTAHDLAIALAKELVKVIWKTADFPNYADNFMDEFDDAESEEYPELNLHRVELSYEVVAEGINDLQLQYPGWIWLQIQREWSLAAPAETRRRRARPGLG